MQALRYLALGDSYTIGEAVPASERWPEQLATGLRATGRAVSVDVVATTGWTTDELDAGLNAALAAGQVAGGYDLVSLLIGVNNQYRGRDVAAYAGEFEALLQRAIGLAGGRAERVFVVSIPDWGATPFAANRDTAQIAREIDAYNAAHVAVAAAAGVVDVDITDISRERAELVAEDGLHPSGMMYRLWADRLLPVVNGLLAAG